MPVFNNQPRVTSVTEVRLLYIYSDEGFLQKMHVFPLVT